MKLLSLWLLVWASFGFLSRTDQPPEDQIVVYVFLYEDCVISQHYTLVLKELHAEYASDRMIFRGIFPNARTDEMDMLIFRGQYELPFEMIKDAELELTRRLGVKVTPEVVVYNATQDQTLYRGRIDDTYFRVGKKRRVTTTSELRDALEAIRRGRPVVTPFTEAVGCFINGA